MITTDERALARAMELFVRHCPIRDGDGPDEAVARAAIVWRSALASVGGGDGVGVISPAFELAWLLLEDASLAPGEAHDDEERILIDRLRLFMALVPEREAWLDYLATHPRVGALAAWRERRAARARLLHGAVHPDDATLAAPSSRHARFVRGHVAGPVVCLSCLRRNDRRVTLAAAGGDTIVEAQVALDQGASPPVEVVLRVLDDAGWLRARVDPLDPAHTPRGRWAVALHADDHVVEGTLALPTDWRGHNLGMMRAENGARPEFHRVELRRLDGPA
ncbi:MAG: hypothetical protein IT385_12615 [Deltaproteobacteria bacterium]|nr:hypothetical protein [Deltaproteobacteria bacterium]